MDRKIPGLQIVAGILIVMPLLALVHERRAVPAHDSSESAPAAGVAAAQELVPAAFQPSPAASEPPKFIPPVYGIITSGFGYRKAPAGKKAGTKVMHEGVDLAAPKNSLFVAPADGTVSAVDRRRGYGAILTITHKAGFETRYAHVGTLFVKEGQTVRSGQPLGVVGLTGRTTGPHIHFEMRRDGQLIDPAPYLDLPTETQIARLVLGASSKTKVFRGSDPLDHPVIK